MKCWNGILVKLRVFLPSRTQIKSEFSSSVIQVTIAEPLRKPVMVVSRGWLVGVARPIMPRHP